MLLVVAVLSDVLPTICPTELALPVHLVVLPLTAIYSTICPFICAYAFNAVLLERSLVNRPICPLEAPFAVFEPLLVVPLVLGSVLNIINIFYWPSLYAVTMLLIVSPFAHVTRPIAMDVPALPVCFVLLPLTLVDITVTINQSTPEVLLIILPKASRN
jgi:hypothetical protein